MLKPAGDILTCGSCHAEFPLTEFVRFLWHKVSHGGDEPLPSPPDDASLSDDVSDCCHGDDDTAVTMTTDRLTAEEDENADVGKLSDDVNENALVTDKGELYQGIGGVSCLSVACKRSYMVAKRCRVINTWLLDMPETVNSGHAFI